MGIGEFALWAIGIGLLVLGLSIVVGTPFFWGLVWIIVGMLLLEKAIAKSEGRK